VTRWSVIARKLHTLARVGMRRQALVAEAALGMLTARIALTVRPFHQIAVRFGTFVRPDDPRVAAPRTLSSADARVARDVGWAVRAAAPFMPFRSVCLQQAMAGHAMLRRRGIHSVIHFGAGRGTDRPLDAHAWLEAGGVKVTGYPVAANFAELGCFV
jgi:hypothetical protein